jgi:hypothetical protein
MTARAISAAVFILSLRDVYPAPLVPNNTPLFARRDFPRPHAELIDVPFADDHLDGRFAGPEHHDFRADRRAVVEIDDVLVRQADAAGRDVGANGHR